ncbi:MAG: ATP--guanido phosphotransferase, partial [Oscillospiraceae bacterium]|nr:ATP--guanido phosphotransferase [Oscillospiraceae bacterium]
MKGNNVVISTRIRLARNLKDYPFPGRLDENGKNKVVATIKSIGFNATYIDMQNLKKEQALSLVERHLISPEFAQSFAGKG